MKKIVSIIMVIAMVSGLFAACGNDSGHGTTESENLAETQEKNEPEMMQANALPLHMVDDNYRTCYEVFVYSFYDSDGDGIGDLKGLTSKLDYINDGDDNTDTDLGCNELWLMPIMPSPTYHKYEVSDYENVDEQYGTLEDFEELVDECHKRGIHLIIDFVMNHTSSRHEWFVKAKEYLLSLPEGQEPDLEECPYVDYYNFCQEPGSGYCQLDNSSWYYEAQFVGDMPDLNLASASVRQEFSDIVQFWLDLGVDGFRLDAVGEYYSASQEKSTAVLEWFTDMVKSKKADAYLVGEAWTSYDVYAKYYASGIDSMFAFSFGDKDGYIAKALNGSATSYGNAINAQKEEIRKYTDSYIDAPFYTNHDMGRGAGYYSGDFAENKTKMAQAMNLMMSGNAFLYYGEELGMKGSGKDENKRVGMYWSQNAEADGMCDGPTDADDVEMIYDSLEEQQDDPYSIYQFVKQAIRLRNIYPAIARGETTFEESLSDENICVLTKVYEEEEMILVWNLSETDQEVDLASFAINGNPAGEFKLAGMLQTGESAPKLEGSAVSLPAYSMILLN